MRIQDHIAATLERNYSMLEMTLADFSDAEMLVRPADGANHAIWQIGHVAVSERQLIGACGAPMPPLPAGFEAKFTKETATCNDAAAFPKKAEVLAVLKQQRDATVAWVKTLSESDMDAAAPQAMREWIPTIGQMALLPTDHVSMHIGQLQVIRRKLGKKILF